jgi:calcineurin-like phosphoesterase family protein
MDYFISNLHLDHANIIDYCDRPFDSVAAMNERLVANWNDVADPGDEVLFGGDLTAFTNLATRLDWLEQLNGEIVYLAGNHDDTVLDTLEDVHFFEHFQFEYGGMRFYAVHDLADAPRDFSGWMIHGHHHNNWPDEFPFVDPALRQINISVELLDYRPLSMNRLMTFLQRGQRYADRGAASSG